MLRDPLPNPLTAAAPYAGILAVAAFAALRGDSAGDVAHAVIVAAAVAGIGAAVWAWVRRVDVCERTDRWIACGAGAPPDREIERARRRQLVAARHRHMLAASLRRLEKPVATPVPRGASAGDPNVAAACAAQLDHLAQILDDESHPVTARAVARAEQLVSEPSSPLYRARPPRVQEARLRLLAVLDDLERDD